MSFVLEEFSTELLTDIFPSVISAPGAAKIFVNGSWVGVHRDPKFLLDYFLSLRWKVDINAEVSIVGDIAEREIRIFTDVGSICRPIFINDHESQEMLIKKIHFLTQKKKKLQW